MQVDIDVVDRPVVVFGTFTGAHRVIKRYHSAGARVTAVLDGPLPPVADRLPGTRYAVRPAVDRMADWMGLLGPSWLAVLVGTDAPTTERVTRLCEHFRVVVVSESAAADHGVVTLVGGGPGVSRLLTVEGCEALREADVVFYDRLAPTEHLKTLAPAAELVDVGKRPHHHPVPQAEIEAQIVDAARQGASVVRLKGGDPFVFGRGAEEAVACIKAGIPVRVVPGVSSAIAVPGAVGIPLTHRGVSHAFTVISGHDPLSVDTLTALARLEGTLVILMGMSNLPQITAGLVRCGMTPGTPAAVIERGFSDTQRTTVASLETLAAEVRRIDAQSPAVVVIGEVVRLIRLGHDELGFLADLDGLTAFRGRQASP